MAVIKLNLINIVTITIAALLGYGLMVTVTKILQTPTMQGAQARFGAGPGTAA